MPQSAHNKINFWREEHIALQEPDSHLKKVKKLSAGGGGGEVTGLIRVIIKIPKLYF